ncbi:MAG: hypothetical protein HY717_18485 [Planctomycetes bacterium]|nr:hypothetical protein [Planctomycetota bacterium]
MTPPFHFVPNPRSIEGWHLRNADNTGPNEAGIRNVNAPGLEREFWFSPSVSRETPITHQEVRRAKSFGRGVFRIVKYTLEDLVPGKQASFAALQFEVDLTWQAKRR